MDPFTHKMRHGAPLTEGDETVLLGLSRPARRAETGDMLHPGTRPRFILLVLDGWAYRRKRMENGKRQVTALFLPGDLCDPFGAVAREHAVDPACPGPPEVPR